MPLSEMRYHKPIPLAELTLVLVGMVDSSGESWAGEASSALTVDVEVDRLEPLMRGARCVSLSSVLRVSYKFFLTL